MPIRTFELYGILEWPIRTAHQNNLLYIKAHQNDTSEGAIKMASNNVPSEWPARTEQLDGTIVWDIRIGKGNYIVVLDK